MTLTLLYRGPLASCNYDCSYCPFGKARHTPDELEQDRRALGRLVQWVVAREQPTDLLFTPWGEALIHRHYQDALVDLTRLPWVRRAAIQTNLSGSLDWLERCDPGRIGIWATYHPASTARGRFLERCRQLHRRGVSFSVGVVGLREHFDEIDGLRRALPEQTYLWINAYKRDPDYYDPSDLDRLRAIDPLFSLNLWPHPSRGRACRAGHDVVAVDGEGAIRRCHFIDDPVGNLYHTDLGLQPAPAPCTVQQCRCHIGYVHLVHLGLRELFGEGLLERALPGWRALAGREGRG